jgi:P-type E1-E2 ATPase
LILATPLAVICGINRAADKGIIVKGGAPLEQIASTKAALFDKTGTITYGTPQVEKIISLNGENEEDLLNHAASIDQFSSHSAALALVQEALKSGKTLSLPEQFQEFPGQGVTGTINGRVYCLGSRSFLSQQLGEDLFMPSEPLIQPYFEQHKLLLYIARDRIALGFLVLSDRMRPGVKELIIRLKNLGVQKVLLVTGDSESNAKALAAESGIEHYKAELFPEEKVQAVKLMAESYSPLIMVGDGINDAPALATATVGIAMGKHGSAISAESADIVLLEDDLNKVAEAIVIGKRMLYIAKQSIFIGMILSFVLMVIASFGYILPAVGAMLQEIIDVVVILNALRAR